MTDRGCYAFPVSGESNARRNRQTYSTGQRNHFPLVGPTLEGACRLPSMQDHSMDTRGACGCIAAPRTRRGDTQRHCVPAHCCRVQNLCARYVFQRCLGWCRTGTSRAAAAEPTQCPFKSTAGAVTKPIQFASYQSAIAGITWLAGFLQRVTNFRPARRCAPDTWGAL